MSASGAIAGACVRSALVALAVVSSRATAQRDSGSTPTSPTPPSARGLVLTTPDATPGYTLIAPLRSTTTYLLDTAGRVAHSWKSAYPPGNTVELLDDGSILRACRVENEHFRTGGVGGRLQRIAWDGTVTWDYALADAQRIQHHEARVLPNGRVLTLVWETWSKADAVAAGRDPERTPDGGLRPDAVLELVPRPPDGADVAWEWHAKDHLIQDFDAERADFGDVAAHPERIDVNADHRRVAPLTEAERARREELERRMRATGYAGGGESADAHAESAPIAPPPRVPGADSDWLHTNSLHLLASHDLLVLSVRHLDEIWVIDHATTTEQARGRTGGRWKHGGDLLYRWGNPRAYGGGTAADRRLFRQHDATWTGAEDGGLALLVFNNGEGRPGGDRSSVDEILLPFDAERGFAPIVAGKPAAPSAARWTWPGAQTTDFYASFVSGAQRLANGHTLVCAGTEGRVIEVARDGRIVWEYRNEHGGEIAAGAPRAAPPGGERGARPAGDGARGPGGLDEQALFRATHVAPDHPGLARLPR